MKSTHDKTANATYITLDVTTNRTVSKTVRVSDICLVDVDKEGYPIGIEILTPPPTGEEIIK